MKTVTLYDVDISIAEMIIDRLEQRAIAQIENHMIHEACDTLYKAKKIMDDIEKSKIQQSKGKGVI